MCIRDRETNEELRQSREELRRHRDELKSKVDAATRRIRTLYEVGQEITAHLDLDRTLGLILDRSLEPVSYTHLTLPTSDLV